MYVPDRGTCYRSIPDTESAPVLPLVAESSLNVSFVYTLLSCLSVSVRASPPPPPSLSASLPASLLALWLRPLLAHLTLSLHSLLSNGGAKFESPMWRHRTYYYKFGFHIGIERRGAPLLSWISSGVAIDTTVASLDVALTLTMQQ